jgi:Protein of unknown function (DUF1579)
MFMSAKSVTPVVLPLVLVVIASSQTGKAPQPSPELKKLDYFVGTWKTEGHTNSGPMGPAGSFSSIDHYEWQKGNFFVIGHSDFKSVMGDGVDLSVLGYDPAKKMFVYHSFNSAGEYESATGTFAGDTWTWHSSEQSPLKWQYVQKVLSPTSFSIKFESSRDGTNWLPLFEGRVTKQ